MSTHFEDRIKEAVAFFRQARPFVVRIVGNQDADGIAAVAVLAQALTRERIKFVASIVRQLTPAFIAELEKEHYDTYFFADLGGPHISLLEQLKGKHVFVFDHHLPEKDSPTIWHLNPQLHGIDGTRDISAAGVAYLFSRCLHEDNKSEAYLALVGALGDGQEDNGFSGYNQDFLDTAVTTGHVLQHHDLRIFGMQTKPLHKALEYSTSPYIPAVTGNEKQAVHFLEVLGIQPYAQGKWKYLRNLTEQEVKKLIVAITTQRIGSDANDEIYGPVYLLASEPEESLLRDLREYSVVLNCCARMNRGGLGMGVCFRSMNSQEKALELHTHYRKDIIDCLHWFYHHKGKEGYVEEGRGYVLINAEESVKDFLLGTLCSLISRSNIYPDGTVILGMAHGLDDSTKISARIAGVNTRDLHVGKILEQIMQKFGGHAGGHSFAAGATIGQDQEPSFIAYAKEILQQQLLLSESAGNKIVL